MTGINKGTEEKNIEFLNITWAINETSSIDIDFLLTSLFFLD
jgi:hypothetical protein